MLRMFLMHSACWSVIGGDKTEIAHMLEILGIRLDDRLVAEEVELRNDTIKKIDA